MAGGRKDLLGLSGPFGSETWSRIAELRCPKLQRAPWRSAHPGPGLERADRALSDRAPLPPLDTLFSLSTPSSASRPSLQPLDPPADEPRTLSKHPPAAPGSGDSPRAPRHPPLPPLRSSAGSRTCPYDHGRESAPCITHHDAHQQHSTARRRTCTSIPCTWPSTAVVSLSPLPCQGHAGEKRKGAGCSSRMERRHLAWVCAQSASPSVHRLFVF